MKKTIITVVLVVASFVAGAEFNNWYYNIDSLFEANNLKRELLDAQNNSLMLVDSLMDKHELYDADGSDLMSDYLESREVVDSLLNTQL